MSLDLARYVSQAVFSGVFLAVSMRAEGKLAHV